MNYLRHASRLSRAGLPLSGQLAKSSRFLSQSGFRLQEIKNNGKNELKSKPQSILNDDLLFKAGVDVEEGSRGKNGVKNGSEGKESGDGEGESGTVGSEGKKKRKRQTSTDIKRERYANWFYIFSFSSLAGVGLYMTRNWEADEPAEWKEKVSDGYSPSLMVSRLKTRFNGFFSYFQEPPFPDLLPPPPPAPYQRPLTLVLSLEDLLVHSEWSQKTGWRTAKRPGVDYFLGYLSQYYEVVLFSSNYMMYSEKIAEKLDPIHAFISYNLFKEHCVYKEGTHIKDLSKLNRDLNKVIIIDTDPNSYKLQSENAIPMKPWEGQPDDKLLQLIPFLEYLATQQVPDVKPILNSFKNKENIPQEFNGRVIKLKEKFYNDEKTKNSNNWLMKMISFPQNQQKTKFPLDLIREEGEKNYVRFIKLIEEEKEKIRIQQEQMAGQTFTLKDYVEGNIPTPEEQMKMQLEKQKEVDAIFEQQKAEKKSQQQK